MVDVYPYLIECLPRRLPIYKERTSNVYLDVYLFSIFSEKDVYLELAPSLKWVDVGLKWVDVVGKFEQQEKTNKETNKKRSFYSCFSTEVDFLTLLGRHSGLTLFFYISRRKIPCLGRRCPRFLHKHVLFFDFWRF